MSDHSNYIKILPKYLREDHEMTYYDITIKPQREDEGDVMYVSRVVLALQNAGYLTEVMELNAKFQAYVAIHGEPE